MSSNVVSIATAVLDAALEYAARGWPVFPCEPRGKKPLTAHGFKDASTLPDVIRSWWKRYPRANVAVPTGARTFDVLDIDGPAGERSLAGLEAKHEELPTGPRQQTGTGRHILFTGGTLGVSAKRLPGLDTRGEGGYVVMAPSVHPSGERYALEDADEPIPAPPAWLVEELRSSRGAAAFAPPAPEVTIDDENAGALLEMAGFLLQEIGEGCRDETLFKRACSMRAAGQDESSILRLLRLANRYLCKPPLSDAEVATKARSAMRYEPDAGYQRAEAKIENRAEAIAQEEAIRSSVSRAAGETTDKSLEALREMLNIPLERIEKRGADYYLVMAEGKTLRLRNLLCFEEVERAIFDGVGVLVAVKRKSWKAAAVRLRAIAHEVDPGLASEEQETLHYLASFLQQGDSVPPIETEEALAELRIAAAPIIHFRDECWFSFDAFRDYCDHAGMRESVRLIWRRIKETGKLREERSFRSGGKVFTRNYWVVTSVARATEEWM